jgi:hypothetical protein
MKTIAACVMSMGLGMAIVGGQAMAKDPAKNVSAKKHPNLSAAQKLIGQAYEKLEASQKANEFDLDGHAKKAKEELKIAADEIKLAAEAANAK